MIKKDWRQKFIVGFLTYMIVLTSIAITASVLLPLMGDKLEPGTWKYTPVFGILAICYLVCTIVCRRRIKQDQTQYFKYSLLLILLFNLWPVISLFRGEGSVMFLSIELVAGMVAAVANGSLLSSLRETL